MSDDGLVAFLTARLDEDRRAADALAFACRLPDKVPDFSGCGGPAAQEYWQHFGAYRHLREVAFWQKVLDAYSGSAEGSIVRDAIGFTVTAYASVWSDHPDYRPEWGP